MATLTLGPNATSRNKLQKLVQLQAFKNNTLYSTYTFLINPEAYQQTEAVRANVVRTLGGGYADLFGPDLVQIQMSGTTGLQQQLVNGTVVDGYERFQDLAKFIRQMWTLPIQDQTHTYNFYLYNWTDDQFYEVLPLQNVWSQAVPRQLVFYYQLAFVGLRETSAPASIAPYAIRAWFTTQPANAVTTSAQDCMLHASLAYEMIERGSTSGLPASALAILKQANNYIPYLQPTDYPVEETYPGVSVITSPILHMLQQTLLPMLNTLVGGGQIPFRQSYGPLAGYASTAQSYLTQLNNLSPTPTLFDAEWGDVCDDLQSFLLYPESFST